MRDIWINRAFAPVKRLLPAGIWAPVRSLGAGLMVPVLFSYRSGHFRSALTSKPVWRNGRPIPWYSYSCVEFLMSRDFSKRRVLEFGAGNSTIWWGERASYVLSLEDDNAWIAKIRPQIGKKNVQLQYAAKHPYEACVKDVLRFTAEEACFDIIVIDGLDRAAVSVLAPKLLTRDGAIICDNSDRYDFLNWFKGDDLQRVDFYGYAPGVVSPHTTSIYFTRDCFLFSPRNPIVDPADLRA